MASLVGFILGSAVLSGASLLFTFRTLRKRVDDLEVERANLVGQLAGVLVKTKTESNCLGRGGAHRD